MNGTYKLTYEAWPYSAPVGEKKEYLESIGERRQTMILRNCQDFRHAYERSFDFLEGVGRNTRVWKTVIVSLEVET